MVEVQLGKTSVEWTCANPDCQSQNSTYLHSGVSIGFQLLTRAQYELKERKDFSLSIVLSAMAVDCELSRLFAKWTRLSTGKTEEELGAETIEGLLRKLGNTRNKIEKVCRLMHSPGIVHFVKASRNLREWVENHFSKEVRIESMVRDIEQGLFWPRNRVLHNAAADYGPDEANRCLELATCVLFVLYEMDAVKAKQGD